MAFAIEIWTGLKEGWQKLKPSHSNKPYLYETKEKAEDIANLCYPLTSSEKIRIVEVV